jgi:hypothetical protein
MAKIQYPPKEHIDKDNSFESCVVIGDPLEIDFAEAGLIFPTATGIFSPDIPAGIFAQGDSITGLIPIAVDTHIVVYFGDFQNQKLYKNTIKIKSKCP